MRHQAMSATPSSLRPAGMTGSGRRGTRGPFMHPGGYRPGRGSAEMRCVMHARLVRGAFAVSGPEEPVLGHTLLRPAPALVTPSTSSPALCRPSRSDERRASIHRDHRHRAGDDVEGTRPEGTRAGRGKPVGIVNTSPAPSSRRRPGSITTTALRSILSGVWLPPARE
jgi:hypothetical protein